MENDQLESQKIKKYLVKDYENISINVYPTLGSTNTLAKLKAKEGAPHGSVILAEEQQKGRGRLGRTFYSPKGSGIYISFILHPQMPIAFLSSMTPALSVAVCQSLERFTEKRLQIKWINDIYLDNKKVGGILTETVMEGSELKALVVGIGLNVFEASFPKELAQIATTLDIKDVSRNEIVGHLINNVLSFFETGSGASWLDEYRRRSNVIGRSIQFMKNDQITQAFALDINEQGELIVQLNNGEKQRLNSGDISVRVKKEDSYEC